MTSAPSQFIFQAMTPSGAKKLGLRAALSESHLTDELRRDQLLLLKAWRVPVGAPPREAVPLRDQAALNDQLAILLARGVPLVESLEVGASVVGEKTKARVERLREQVAAGASFSRACEQVGGFDPVSVAVYRAAERTGDLASAAGRLASSAKRRLAIAGKTLTVLIYPAIVTLVALSAFFALLIFVVPMLADQLTQMKAKLNPLSAVVFGVGVWMRTNLWLVGVGLLVLIVGLLMIRRWIIAAVVAAGQSIPSVRRLMLTVEMARFFSVMAAMTRTGVPLADALSTAVGVISQDKLREQLTRLQKGLVEGGIFRALVEKVDELPLATRRLLIAAERGGDLDSAFDGLSTDMSNEVDVRAARLVALLEPALIALMFILLAPLILAIAIPMMTARTSAGFGG